MKVAIIPPKTKTGEGTLNKYLIDGLQQRGIDVKILNHFVFDRPNVRLFLGSLLLRHFIGDDSISIVHNVDNLGPFLLAHNDLTAKMVLSVHDIAPIVLPWLFKHPRYRLMQFDFTTILPRLIENSDLVIVPSHSTRDDLISRVGVKREKIAIIPFGVDTAFFYPRSDYSDVLARYELRHKFLLYVGNDFSRKNLVSLVRAYAHIFSEIPHDLVLVGPINKTRLNAWISSTNISPDLKRALRERITLLGYVARNDLPSIYSAATAFIFPSLYEGFGLPPLEAMACGTVSVVSKNSSLTEVIGEYGIFIENPLDSEEISARIFQAIKEDKSVRDLTARGLEHVKKFTWEKTVEATIAAYHHVAHT